MVLVTYFYYFFATLFLFPEKKIGCSLLLYEKFNGL